MGLGVEAGDGIPLLPLPQHDSKGLVVPPATSQVDVCIQEVTNIGRKHVPFWIVYIVHSYSSLFEVLTLIPIYLCLNEHS